MISRSVRISHFEATERTFRCEEGGCKFSGMIHLEGILENVDLRLVAAMSDQLDGDILFG